MRAQERLKAIGEWMKLNSRSIYGCTQAPPEFKAPANSLLTYNPVTNRLYVHLLAYPMGSVVLPDMAGKVKYVQFLHDASEIRFDPDQSENKNNVYLQLPVQKPPVEIAVLEVFLK
jgi:alpha-L-fucosidase